jgi:hypothetical protein
MSHYQARGLFGHSEEDIFKTGCQMKGGSTKQIDQHFDAGSEADLIRKIARFLGIDDKENILINSCEEPGRVDFQLYEDKEGTAASAAQLEQWKAGKCRLWLVTYTAQFEHVTSGAEIPAAALELA